MFPKNSRRAISSVITMLLLLVTSLLLGTGVITFSNGIFVNQANQESISTQNMKIWVNQGDSGVAWAAAGVRNNGDKISTINKIQVRNMIIPYSNWYVEKNQSAVSVDNYQSQYIFTGTNPGGMMKNSLSLSPNNNCHAGPTVIEIDFDGSSGPKPMLCLNQASGPITLHPGERMIIYFRLPNGLLTALDSGQSTNLGIFSNTAGAPVNVVIGNSDQGSQYSASTIVFLVRTGFPDESSLISLYQKHARSSDIIAQFSQSLLDNTVTSQISSQKTTTYFSLNDIQNNANTLASNGYTWVGYDLEPGLSPANEVADPVGSVQQASQIAHNNGLKLIVTPAGIPLQNFQGMASYSDGFVLQAQDLINDPDLTVFVNTVTTSVNDIKMGNPNCMIILQGSTIKDTPDQINAAYDLVKDKVDGITVFYNNNVNDIAQIAQVLTHVDGIS